MSVQKPISSVNDFVVRFANVNGSGSASANEMFARSILRHGVPVSPRNIFPSNIQGLPTWYEVRVTEEGHLGAREQLVRARRTRAVDVGEFDDEVVGGAYRLHAPAFAVSR